VLKKYVENLQVNEVQEEVQKMLDNDVDPKEIEKQLLEGLKEVGRKYENGEYFIGDLVVSGIMMKEIFATEKMKSYLKTAEKNYNGKIVLGTVSDDIHDIGKDIMFEMFTSAGFEVIDLGVDVPTEEFIRAIVSLQPDIVGISCILTTCIDNIQATIDGIEQKGLRDHIKIIVGGTAIHKKYGSMIRADAFTNDAQEGLRICESWMKEKTEKK